MFIDLTTRAPIHANLDATITNSPRIQDRLPAFLDVIKDTVEYAQIMVSNGGIPAYAMDDADDDWWDDDDCYCLEESLFDVLNDYAPIGYYFGDLVEDELNFGYWKCDK